jgi:hypothetical protein
MMGSYLGAVGVFSQQHVKVQQGDCHDVLQCVRSRLQDPSQLEASVWDPLRSVEAQRSLGAPCRHPKGEISLANSAFV